MKQLRVAVLGQGRSGYDIHVKWLREDQERYKLVAVSDLMPERTTESVEEFGAKPFADYHALLQDKSLKLDLVINALPSNLHPEGTIEALDAGYHVVCEKPLARTAAGFDSMVEASQTSGKLLFPFQNGRFQPAFRKIQEVIGSGCLGRIINIRINYGKFSRRWDWQTSREMWGGNLLNTGPHPMDQAIVLFGERTPNVFARLVSDNPFGDADNFVAVTLWGENAPTIEVAISSFLVYPQGPMYSVSGTCGGLSGESDKLDWKYFDPAAAPDQATKGKWSDERGYCKESLDWTERRWALDPELDATREGHRCFYDNVYAVLFENAPRVITLEQVRRQIAAIEEAHRQNPNPA